ncbi:MAG: hypothetical protein KF897_09450 [Opitutaceae bacterium]|nr:hypothetical protein [Opitutaceae bacterium]
MNRLLRFALIGLVSLAGVLLVATVLAFTPAVQTWAARRVLSGQPGYQVSLGRVAAGLRQVQVEAGRFQSGRARLDLPHATADLAVIDAIGRDRLMVRSLVARGWTLDLTAASGSTPAAAAAPATPEAAAAAVALVFRGIFTDLRLPVDLAVDGVDLAGEVILPGPPGQAPTRAQVILQGGGLSGGREGAFTFAARFALAGEASPVRSLEVNGRLEATMDTPRTFTRLGARFDARAAGPALSSDVQLTAEVIAARVPGGENYALNVQSLGKRLVDLQANYPAESARFGGVWKLDVRDTDLAPFALGRPLPAFEAVGAGMFESDTAFNVVHAAGRLQSSASRLGIFRPELDVVGVVGLFSEFDLTLHQGAVRVDRLLLNVSRPEPVLAVQSQQAFEFRPRTGELKVADPAADLVVIRLQDLPVRWLAPFVQPYVLTGGALRGELTAGAAGGGLVVRTRTPLRLDGLGLADSQQPLLAHLDVEAEATAEYSPLGWQVDLAALRLGGGAAPWLTLAAKAGRRAGADQPTKATGHWNVQLPALLQQPVLLGTANLTGGRGQGDFTVSLGRHREVQASLRFDELAVPTGENLPTIAADLRADTAADGRTDFNLPIVISQPAHRRQSDLAAAGSLQVQGGDVAIEARVTSREVFLDDVQVLGAIAAATAASTADPGRASAAPRPFWAGMSGRIELALQKLHLLEGFEVTDVAGTVRLEAGALKVPELRVGLGQEGSAKVAGGLVFDPASSQPYVLDGDVSVRDFNPRPLFASLGSGQSATVDGRFDLNSHMTGRAATLPDVLGAAQGAIQLTSKGGVFHGLPVNVASKAESTSRIAAGVAAVGSLLGSVTGKKEYADIANRAQAVSEISRLLAAIPYDQLSVKVTRDDPQTARLEDFTLISPELRLTGDGRSAVEPGASILDGALAMEFKLRARGRAAHLLKYLGTLEGEPDVLGYTGCNLPLRIGGTLRAPDTSEINRTLTALAVEKSGAGDLLNKLLGGGK